MIVGFAGTAGSGKDTCAGYLANKYGGAVLSFATPLKELVIEYYGLNRDEVYGSQIQKNYLTKYKWGDMVGYSGENPSYNMSVREILEYVGTEIMRKANPNIWIEMMKYKTEKLVTEGKSVFIADVRFINECEMIKSLGGKIIKLTRGEYTSGHLSNVEWRDYQNYDFILDNINLGILEQFKVLDNYINAN